jgi:hypothetical protein
MRIIRRSIYGHNFGLWKQQPGWWVLDIYRLRLEFIRGGGAK